MSSVSLITISVVPHSFSCWAMRKKREEERGSGRERCWYVLHRPCTESSVNFSKQTNRRRTTQSLTTALPAGQTKLRAQGEGGIPCWTPLTPYPEQAPRKVPSISRGRDEAERRGCRTSPGKLYRAQRWPHLESALKHGKTQTVLSGIKCSSFTEEKEQIRTDGLD